jgi:hypothetical protein
MRRKQLTIAQLHKMFHVEHYVRRRRGSPKKSEPAQKPPKNLASAAIGDKDTQIHIASSQR